MNNNSVYEPGEDTFTLTDAILADIHSIPSNSIILEIGCGSGYISEQILQNNRYFIISTDINREALLTTKNNNKIQTDLLNNIRQEEINCVIFNPPYLETFDDSKIYDGKKYGREIIDRFIDNVTIKLIYLLIIKLNKPKEIINMLENKGYKVEIIKERKVQGESIIILKCIKLK